MGIKGLLDWQRQIVRDLKANLRYLNREKWAKRKVCRDGIGRFARWST